MIFYNSTIPTMRETVTSENQEIQIKKGFFAINIAFPKLFQNVAAAISESTFVLVELLTMHIKPLSASDMVTLVVMFPKLAGYKIPLDSLQSVNNGLDN